MTTPINRRQVHVDQETLRRTVGELTRFAKDLGDAHETFRQMMQGLWSRDEYIEHLERRLADLVDRPEQAGTFATLAALETLGARIQLVRCPKDGGTPTSVVIYWPGHDTPFEHVRDVDASDRAFAAQLRDYASAIQEQQA